MKLHLLLLSPLLGYAVAQGAQKTRDEMTAEERAVYDMQTGMMGLKEAASNPALLAQMMEDLKDPEIMAEAQKMMASPEYQEQMKKMEHSKDFKDALKMTKEKMADPNLAAKMEAQMEYMMKKGQDDLNTAARQNMQAAMDALQDPETLAEAANMMKDPRFEEMIKTMMKDPGMVRQMQEMKGMMEDPNYREKMEKVGKQFASAMQGNEL
uniref:STI1 domain-containing protein n=1 Tax=Leptocylindrus danicus TaxID=163516 RepID=A0A7S2K5H0_9STRA